MICISICTDRGRYNYWKYVYLCAKRRLQHPVVWAVNRAGHLQYDPSPDYNVYPGDRLLLIGPLERLQEAEEQFNRFKAPDMTRADDQFELAELKVEDTSGMAGKTIAEAGIRSTYGVSVVGIKRGELQLTSVGSG